MYVVVKCIGFKLEIFDTNIIIIIIVVIDYDRKKKELALYV